MITEADTCRKYVIPKLVEAGWENSPHSITEQKTFTDGRIVVAGARVRRRPQKRADFLLRYTRDFPLAVVEAKPTYPTEEAALAAVRRAVVARRAYARSLALGYEDRLGQTRAIAEGDALVERARAARPPARPTRRRRAAA